ncbi:hypothetical protein UFOVP121_61 [uncultured Caudovirales phage]|uniref:Uncharacterized protein n=1 Tax=uncultured Caudovirales phage TaxID=2100421 RepID=A0A6J5LQ85_9CAUD|nr:hypothetical protein UFOVP121_61 [uncultured Caudovirales phage]CAB4135076.1 hypothetical protein UFOVP277_66 [uncultured Caudovirales phage]
MAFVQAPSDAEQATDITMAEATETTAMLKRRVRDTGARHGKAFGLTGAVTTSYISGFGTGFIAAFKD